MTVSGRKVAWAGALAGLLVLVGVTAWAGGFEEVAEPPVSRFGPGEEITVGPYQVTFGTAVTVVDREAYVDEGEPLPRSLMIPVRVATTSEDFTETSQLTSVIAPKKTAGVARDGGKVIPPSLSNRADGTAVYVVNPGQTYDLVLEFEQEPDWHGDQVTLKIERLEWLEEDPTGLAHHRWLYTGDIGSRVRIPVERAGGGR